MRPTIEYLVSNNIKLDNEINLVLNNTKNKNNDECTEIMMNQLNCLNLNDYLKQKRIK